MSIADHLRQLMAARGVQSENELDRATGVPQPTINRILRGKSKRPEFRTLEPLARYFGITVDRLVNGPLRVTNAQAPAVEEPAADYKVSTPALSEEERTILDIYRRLGPEEQRTWRAVGSALDTAHCDKRSAADTG